MSGATLRSTTFAALHEDGLPVPRRYRSSVVTLERLSTSSITLQQLHCKVAADLQSDPELPRFDHAILDRINHIERVALQLGEDVAAYPPLCFAPGCLADELDALIAMKEQQLMDTKAARMSHSSVHLCEAFLHGCCPNGVTCTESHTQQSLATHLRRWLAEQVALSGGETLTITEVFGPNAWEALIGLLSDEESLLPSAALVMRTVDRSALQVITRAITEGQLKGIRFLDISKNRICEVFPRGVLKIAKALPHIADTLTGLSLGFNALGVSGALAIVKAVAAECPGLQSLNLSGNGITATDPGFMHLCQALGTASSLSKLSLASNPLGPDGCRKLLSQLGGAEHEGSATLAGEDGASAESCGALCFLDLFNTSLGDEGCTHVSEFLRVRSAGRQLRFLNLSWNRITFDGVAALAGGCEGHACLEVLRMYFNLGIGRKGAIAIADLVKQLPALQVLDVRWTGLGDDGALTVSDALASNKMIREVNVSCNELDPRTEQLINERLRKRPGAAPPTPSSIQRSDEVW